MTPQEALQILDQAAAQVQAVRAFHEQVVNAVKVLNEFVQAHNDNPNDKLGEEVKAESVGSTGSVESSEVGGETSDSEPDSSAENDPSNQVEGEVVE